VSLRHEVGDRRGVLGIGLERLIVRDVLPPLGVGRQDADDREAELGEVVGEGEAVILCNLKSAMTDRPLPPDMRSA
jgi:hypothetical protein